jgi:hypothetical protein
MAPFFLLLYEPKSTSAGRDDMAVFVTFLDANGRRTPMPVSLKDILGAFEFVSAGGIGEHQAFLCKQSGKILLAFRALG